MSEEIRVYGAGMSGMIAAIHLARRGYRVILHDREEGYGGSRIFNPSLHVTPLDLERTSGYLEMDLGGAFHPLVSCPSYFGDLEVDFPVEGVYVVERGERPSSLDALLFGMCEELGVDFAWGSGLDGKTLSSLPRRSIIACGLNPGTYRLLGIPHLRWEAWMARGEREMAPNAWLWWDRCINEYGYFTAANGIWFDMLFSIGRTVGRECLERYRDFRLRRQGLDDREWEYVTGATPVAEPGNPRLFWRDAILCGTMSGAIDPLMGFGISGALVTGSVAARAVYDPEGALRELRRFTRMFAPAWHLKNRLWWRFIRPHPGAVRGALRLVGVSRVELLGRMVASGRIPLKGAIPGFNALGCH